MFQSKVFVLCSDWYTFQQISLNSKLWSLSSLNVVNKVYFDMRHLKDITFRDCRTVNVASYRTFVGIGCYGIRRHKDKLTLHDLSVDILACVHNAHRHTYTQKRYENTVKKGYRFNETATNALDDSVGRKRRRNWYACAIHIQIQFKSCNRKYRSFVSDTFCG